MLNLQEVENAEVLPVAVPVNLLVVPDPDQLPMDNITVSTTPGKNVPIMSPLPPLSLPTLPHHVAPSTQTKYKNISDVTAITPELDLEVPKVEKPLYDESKTRESDTVDLPSVLPQTSPLKVPDRAHISDTLGFIGLFGHMYSPLKELPKLPLLAKSDSFMKKSPLHNSLVPSMSDNCACEGPIGNCASCSLPLPIDLPSPIPFLHPASEREESSDDELEYCDSYDDDGYWFRGNYYDWEYED